MSNNTDNLKLSAEKFKKIIREIFSQKISDEQLGSIIGLSEALATFASGEFECKSCKDKYRIHAIKH